MPKTSSPRSGSLQFWPRKRANKILPSSNWKAISKEHKDSERKLLGFIGYKVGMKSAYIKDNTPNSLTKDKKKVIPVTIIECPPMKILAVRFYKDRKVMKDILAENLDKELKKKIKMPKGKKKVDIESVKEYDDVSIIAYSQVKKTGIKKRPDIIEMGLNGSSEEKIAFIKENLGKEIGIKDVFQSGSMIDIKSVTKGKGFSGPVKRFGIALKFHKSEKGQRRPGSLGPWHPARVIFRVPMAGQLGMFTRSVYNLHILHVGDKEDAENLNLKDLMHYGNIKSDYIIVNGSVGGSKKRQLIVSAPLRGSKRQNTKDFEFIELR